MLPQRVQIVIERSIEVLSVYATKNEQCFYCLRNFAETVSFYTSDSSNQRIRSDCFALKTSKYWQLLSEGSSQIADDFAFGVNALLLLLEAFFKEFLLLESLAAQSKSLRLFRVFEQVRVSAGSWRNCADRGMCLEARCPPHSLCRCINRGLASARKQQYSAVWRHNCVCVQIWSVSMVRLKKCVGASEIRERCDKKLRHAHNTRSLRSGSCHTIPSNLRYFDCECVMQSMWAGKESHCVQEFHWLASQSNAAFLNPWALGSSAWSFKITRLRFYLNSEHWTKTCAYCELAKIILFDGILLNNLLVSKH